MARQHVLLPSRQTTSVEHIFSSVFHGKADFISRRVPSSRENRSFTTLHFWRGLISILIRIHLKRPRRRYPACSPFGGLSHPRAIEIAYFQTRHNSNNQKHTPSPPTQKDLHNLKPHTNSKKMPAKNILTRIKRGSLCSALQTMWIVPSFVKSFNCMEVSWLHENNNNQQ